MTTIVTIKTASHTAYVYTAPLDEDLCGDFKLCQTVEPEMETTVTIHNRQDVMVTENKLEE